MTSPIQERADAAMDSYANRSQSDVDKKAPITLDGRQYQIFGYANDPISGFHATAYKEAAPPHNIIIAYRGTDPGLFSGQAAAEKRAHALTTVQDIAVDASMVRDMVNPQKSAADAFTQTMIDKAAHQGIGRDQISVAGHSLGGTLAEIEAAKYGLAGSTYNAYGAVGMLDGPPQPGCHLTNYRMAGDVVSAANLHIGEVVSLASRDDVQSLRDGRYLDAPTDAPPPNALIAMRLGDHGGQQHFDSNSQDNLLEPKHFRDAMQRYAEHKPAFDQFSGDVAREGSELSQALNQMKAGYGPRGLPPTILRQVDEYLVLHADQPVRNAIEQNGIAQAAEHGLQQDADVARAVGHSVQTRDERVASVASAVCEAEVHSHVADLIPWAPLADCAVGEAIHLHGQMADAAGHFVGDRLASAKSTVEQGMHNTAQAVVGVMHNPRVQANAANLVNHVVDTYDRALDTYHDAQAAGRALSHDIDAAGKAAGQAFGKLAHPGQWFHHDAPAPTAAAGSAGSTPFHANAQTIASAGTNFARNDPRHPDNPQHGLYETLEHRIPEASTNRLLQFTAACHEQGITEKNIGRINHVGGVVQIQNRELGPPAQIDMHTNPPSPQASIQQILQADAMQAQVQASMMPMNLPQNLPGQQAPTMGGGPMR